MIIFIFIFIFIIVNFIYAKIHI